MADFNSPFYPYEKVYSYNTLNGAEGIPMQVLMYLLDLPDKNGYVPVDDNTRPRVRLMKYIYYDEPNPLAKPLPTPEQKLSLVYSGNNVSPNTEEDRAKHPKGYRLMFQNYTMPSELDARVMVKCWMARVIPRSDFKTILGINFEISVNYAQDNVMQTTEFSRMYAIFQCLIESLHGVNIAGIGTVHFNKSVHGDCGYTTYHTEGTSVYGNVFMAIEWQESENNGIVPDYMDEYN